MTENLPPEKISLRSRLAWLAHVRVVMVLVVTMLAVTPFVIRGYRLSGVPDVPPPFDVDAFVKYSVPDEENAFFYFQQAHDTYESGSVEQRRKAHEALSKFTTRGTVITWADVPAELQSWLDEQQPVLELFRKGARCSKSLYIPADQWKTTVLLPVVQTLRVLHQLAQIEALRQLNEGHVHEAAEILHDAFRASRHLGQRGCIIERYVGMACHALVVPAWHEWSRRPDVTAEEIEAALERLRADWALTAPPSENLKIQFLVISNELKKPLTYQRAAISESLTTRTMKWFGNLGPSVASRLDGWFPGWQLPILATIGESEFTGRSAKLWLTHELKTCDLPLAQQPVRGSGFYALSETADLTAGLTTAQLERIFQRSYLNGFTGPPLSFHVAVNREVGRQALLETELLLQIAFRRNNVTTRAEAERVLAEFVWPVDPRSATGDSIVPHSTDDGLELWSGERVVIPWPGGE